MIVRREWKVYCACPDCGEPMAPLMTVQEQHYPAAHNMPEHTYLSPSMISGLDYAFCQHCLVAHDPSKLEPVLTKIDHRKS